MISLKGIDSELFKRVLRQQLSDPLPGRNAHKKLFPLHRLNDLKIEPAPDAVSSSVLLLLYPYLNSIYTIVILRAEYDGVHSGQISLPGGRVEPSDKNLEETAIRETREETGIDVQSLEILGSLSSFYIDRSNFIVHPFVGFLSVKPLFRHDPVEVQEVIELDLNSLLKPDAIITRNIALKNGLTIQAPGFQVEKHFMWGATAMIFSEFIEIFNKIKFR